MVDRISSFTKNFLHQNFQASYVCTKPYLCKTDHIQSNSLLRKTRDFGDSSLLLKIVEYLHKHTQAHTEDLVSSQTSTCTFTHSLSLEMEISAWPQQPSQTSAKSKPFTSIMLFLAIGDAYLCSAKYNEMMSLQWSCLYFKNKEKLSYGYFLAG